MTQRTGSRPPRLAGRRRARRLAGDQTGVATVLGAVLVLGLVAVALVAYQTEHVPHANENREAAHMQQLGHQMALVKGDLDRQTDNRTASSISNPLTLQRSQGFGLLRSTALPGEVRFEPGATGAESTLSAPKLQVFQRDGRSLLGLGENWTLVSTGDVEDIDSVEHLRIRVQDPEGGDEGDYVQLTIRNADGSFGGKIRVEKDEHPSGYTMLIIVDNDEDPTNSPLFQGGESAFQQDQPAWHFVDAMDPQFLFDQLLASAKAPFTLEWEESGYAGEYATSFRSVSGGRQGNSGLVEENFSQSLGRGGALVATVPNSEFPSQTFRLEHGAVIVSQADGSAFRARPGLTFSASGDTVSALFTVPALEGAPDARTSDHVNVRTDPVGGGVNLAGQVPSLHYTIATPHGSLWSEHWTDMLESLGLRSASGHFAVSSNATHATLDLYGAVSDPASEVYDIEIQLRKADIRVELE